MYQDERMSLATMTPGAFRRLERAATVAAERVTATVTAARTAATITVAAIAMVAAAGCARSDSDGSYGGEAAGSVTVFEGARIITGNGSVIEAGVFVVEDGRFAAVGASGDIAIPSGAARVDLTGKSVMPAIVNAHIHLATGQDARTEQLLHLAYYGTGAAVSLGTDSGTFAFEVRDNPVPGGARSKTAGRGITMPEPGRSEVPYWIETEEAAREAVRELAAQGADIVKIWVDDRGGRYEKLSSELYAAVIDEAHRHDLKVTAHVFYLEDAKGLLLAGVDAFAHGVRDLDADEELMQLWQSNSHVVLVPNLPGPGVRLDLAWLSGTVPADQLQEMQEASADNPAAQESFGIQARNLARFRDAGVKIAFGTDGSAAWTAHQEMEDMVRAGMTPAEVITAATRTSAELMEWSEVGEIAVGKSADFIALDANPLEDIAHTRRIYAVYLRGEQVDREAIGARLLGARPQ